jgi:hypothetical protein
VRECRRLAQDFRSFPTPNEKLAQTYDQEAAEIQASLNAVPPGVPAASASSEVTGFAGEPSSNPIVRAEGGQVWEHRSGVLQEITQTDLHDVKVVDENGSHHWVDRKCFESYSKLRRDRDAALRELHSKAINSPEYMAALKELGRAQRELLGVAST